ncbi:MAG: hypothetical protein JRN20_05755 [Nitrososphaerota archaeon]|jgi:hypothetical protein|nr:hypothetical protein [Nitrososphaerota archaeon]MDG6921861.1 hypothetical protein [Nitrososphaerota archaeon]
MIKFSLSVAKPYGSLSIESEDEKELLANVSRLKKLGESMDRLLVSEVEPSQDVISSCNNLANVQKVLVALLIADSGLERNQYIRISSKLGVPIGWWNGSNFQRDLRKLPTGFVDKTNSNGRTVLKLTTKGKRYTRSLLSKVNHQ